MSCGAELPTAIWPHTVSFSTPKVSKVKTLAGRGVCMCMCLCLDKQVKNVSGDDPFLPQAHLGIFVAPSHLFLSLFFRFLSWSFKIVQGDSLECYGRLLSHVCVCAYVCRWTWHRLKTGVSLVFSWCSTALCRGAGLELKSLLLHVAWAVQRPGDTLWNYSGY